MRENLIFHNVEQGTEDWHKLRLGKMSGSVASVWAEPTTNRNSTFYKLDGSVEKIPGNKTVTIKSGKHEGTEVLISSSAVTYINEKSGELITGERMPNFDNYSTNRGHEYEPFALNEYEQETFRSVDRVGFIELNKYVGMSPDAVYFDEDNSRLIEAKSLMHKNHTSIIDTKEYIDKDYYYQVQFNMFILGVHFADLVNFHPGFKKNRLIIREIPKNEELFNRFDLCAAVFEQEVKRLVSLDFEPKLELVK